MRKIKPIVRLIILTLIYAFFFTLPGQLSKVLNDYSFNFALSQLTLTLLVVSYDYELFAKEMNKFSLNSLLGFLTFISSSIIFATFIFMSLYTPINYNDLLYPISNNNTLLVIMETFSIVLCLHINEAYLYLKFVKNIKHSNRRIRSGIALVTFIAIHLLLVYLTKTVLLNAIIYYLLIGCCLSVIHYLQESEFIYVFAALIVFSTYIFLF